MKEKSGGLGQLNLKETVNLPQTAFSMRARLLRLEPQMLQRWDEMDLYAQIRSARQGQPVFLLHDGPPYANGHIHLGHCLNKILKDLIVKTKTMKGYDSPFIPGWDCHGLPIEIQVVGKKGAGLDPLQVRNKCRQYAQEFVELQRQEFIRLGIFGDWHEPYLTMSNGYEAEITRVFGQFVERGSVYKGLKPVHWCIHCETALAEAEVEYQPHQSPSVYVRFPVKSIPPPLAHELQDRRISALTWTTTPWTLPANLGMCLHPELEYSLVKADGEWLLIASALLEAVARDCGLREVRVERSFKGRDLRDWVFQHPWLERESKSLLGEHVTLAQGTGLVHTAPGHGQEDYTLGTENGLDAYCPVDNSGRFTSDVAHFAGLNVFEANARITQFMKQNGMLLAQQPIEHSYPHCWRCHNPVIFRATPQWFISIDDPDIRKPALRAIDQVQWLPSWGRERIHQMIAHRPDWCISRQRIWGVPIPAFYCSDCGEALLEGPTIKHVASIFERESADAWYRLSTSQLLPPDTRCSCGSKDFRKEFDILDVWFDSGSSHRVVLGAGSGLPWPADVYLEGADQYRGWFHSSLLIAVGTGEGAPYRTVICSGWTLDAEGRAMSKSLGNAIPPLDIMKKDGAEILRLWVASIDYTEDVRLGEEILSHLREAYRKLRNTQRFLLGNLYDYDASLEVPGDSLLELDRWALARMARTARQVEEAYRNYEFHAAYHALYNFCVLDLSNFYLDVLKDRLYISPPESEQRRAAQSALFRIADTLVKLLAPLLPFTAEEVWDNLFPGEKPAASVHLAQFSERIHDYSDPQVLARWERLLVLRERVSKALEESRQKKELGTSLEAKLTLHCGSEAHTYLRGFQDLASLFIVSEVTLKEGAGLEEETIEIRISKAEGEKCNRCWHYRTSVGSSRELPQVCGPCLSILKEMSPVHEAHS